MGSLVCGPSGMALLLQTTTDLCPSSGACTRLFTRGGAPRESRPRGVVSACATGGAAGAPAIVVWALMHSVRCARAWCATHASRTSAALVPAGRWPRLCALRVRCSCRMHAPPPVRTSCSRFLRLHGRGVGPRVRKCVQRGETAQACAQGVAVVARTNGQRAHVYISHPHTTMSAQTSARRMARPRLAVRPAAPCGSPARVCVTACVLRVQRAPAARGLVAVAAVACQRGRPVTGLRRGLRRGVPAVPQ